MISFDPRFSSALHCFLQLGLLCFKLHYFFSNANYKLLLVYVPDCNHLSTNLFLIDRIEYGTWLTPNFWRSHQNGKLSEGSIFVLVCLGYVYIYIWFWGRNVGSGWRLWWMGMEVPPLALLNTNSEQVSGKHWAEANYWRPWYLHIHDQEWQ